MKTKAKETVLRYGMLPAGGSVTVALSGGADSVALLHLLRQLQKELDFSLSACHVNHLLRGEESERDEMFVRALCEEWKIPLTVFRENVAVFAEEEGLSLEEAGRTVRYRCLRQAAKGGIIATAHTRSDDAETFFINLTRGTGLKGLCGITPKQKDLIRPLLFCTRQEVQEYLAQEGLSFVEDSSNASDDFVRNRIRHHLMPQLLRLQPAFYELFGRTKEHLRQDEDFLQQSAQRLLSDARCQNGLSAEKLRDAHPAVLFRALKAFLGEQGLSCGSVVFSQLQNLLEKKSGRLQIDPVWTVQLQKGVLQAVRSQGPVSSEPMILSAGEAFTHPLAKGRILPVNYEQFKNLWEQDCNILKNAIDCDKIFGKIFLRAKIEGDALRPVHRGVTKPLRKWWNELGVPPQKRERLPVLADERGPVWAAGLGVDERAAADKKSKTIWVIDIEEAEQ